MRCVYVLVIAKKPPWLIKLGVLGFRSELEGRSSQFSSFLAVPADMNLTHVIPRTLSSLFRPLEPWSTVPLRTCSTLAPVSLCVVSVVVSTIAD